MICVYGLGTSGVAVINKSGEHVLNNMIMKNLNKPDPFHEDSRDGMCHMFFEGYQFEEE